MSNVIRGGYDVGRTPKIMAETTQELTLINEFPFFQNSKSKKPKIATGGTPKIPYPINNVLRIVLVAV